MDIDVLDPDEKLSRKTPVKPQRQLLFISHANPEDNVFAEWLATQLAIAGYEVWCDVTQLLGGEKFWDDITEALDDYAFRVLFVSTLEGNRKPGTLRELTIAHEAQEREQLKDFIVPIKVDAFPFGSMDPRLQNLNVMRFDQGWSAGLAKLLKLLDREGAPRSETAGAESVIEWYKGSIESKRKVVVSNDRLISNWFRLELPAWLYFHHFRGHPAQLGTVSGLHPHPQRIHGGYLVTFSESLDCDDDVMQSFDLATQIRVDTQQFISDGSPELGIASQDAANMVTDLVRQGWESEMKRRAFCSYQMSGQQAWFYPKGRLDKDRLYFGTPKKGRRSWRQVVGNKSKRTAEGDLVPDGHWHYAVSGSPQLLPFPRIVLKHHVVFTDDGETPWKNVERMVRARRRVCKNWWNREWRDRLLAFCESLKDDEDSLRLPVGMNETVLMEISPMSFVSPWTYFEDNQTGLDETQEIQLVEDEDESDEGDEDITDEDDDEYG